MSKPTTPKVEPIPEPVLDAIVTQLGIPEEQVTRESRLVEDLGADSLDTVEIAMTLEETFNLGRFSVDEEEIFEEGTVGGIIDLLIKKGVRFE